jgi:hypothetical protein
MHRALLFLIGIFSYVASPTFGADEVVERAVQSQVGVMQQVPQTRTSLQSPTIEQQLAALQQQVQALQAQMAALQSVLKIATDGTVTILSPMSISVQAGKDISIGAGQHVSVQGNGAARVEGKSGLDLKGMPIKLNGGSKPVATVGSQVQVPGQPIGQVTTGSGTIFGN